MVAHKVGGDRSGHFLQASVTLGSRAIEPWEAFDPISLLRMMPKDAILSSCRTVRICIRVLFLIVSEEAVQVSNRRESDKQHQDHSGKARAMQECI